MSWVASMAHVGLLEFDFRTGGSTTGVILRSGAGLLRRMISGEEWILVVLDDAAGHVIRGCAPPATAGDILNSRAIFSSLLGGPWVAVAQNVDDDLTWTCPTSPAPDGFMDRFRAVFERD